MADEPPTNPSLSLARSTLEAALASMNDGLYIADAKGRLLDFNDAFVKFMRFDSRAACKTQSQEYAQLVEVRAMDGQPVPPEQWAIPRALRGETQNLLQVQLRRTDTGEEWIGSYSFAPIRDLQDHIVGAVVTVRDVTEFIETRDALKRTTKNLRKLVNQMHTVEERERKRIARELHDDLQQSLFGIMIRMAALEDSIGRDYAASVKHLREAKDLAAQTIESARRIVNDLRPQILDDLGLAEGLRSLCQSFKASTGMECDLLVRGHSEVSPEVATCLYRVAQEALNNVHKHAKATLAHLSLEHAAHGRLHLKITDDGQGIRPEDQAKDRAFGLLGMAERVRALGGEIQVVAPPEGGTTVTVDLPDAQPAKVVTHDGADAGAQVTAPVVPQAAPKSEPKA